ncbi:hypothetical protein Tco_0260110 [Tanacetum coccineum]
MFNDVKLQVDYECEMAFELLRLGRIVRIKRLHDDLEVTAAKLSTDLISLYQELFDPGLANSSPMKRVHQLNFSIDFFVGGLFLWPHDLVEQLELSLSQQLFMKEFALLLL